MSASLPLGLSQDDAISPPVPPNGWEKPVPLVAAPRLAVRAGLAVSVTVSVCVPAVLKAIGKVPVPAVSVVSAGRTACGSLLAKWILPEYAVSAGSACFGTRFATGSLQEDATMPPTPNPTPSPTIPEVPSPEERPTPSPEPTPFPEPIPAHQPGHGPLPAHDPSPGPVGPPPGQVPPPPGGPHA